MKTSTAILLILLGLVLIAFAPLAFIWALNTLFTLGIPYTFWTWLASLVLTSSLVSYKK